MTVKEKVSTVGVIDFDGKGKISRDARWMAHQNIQEKLRDNSGTPETAAVSAGSSAYIRLAEKRNISVCTAPMNVGMKEDYQQQRRSGISHMAWYIAAAALLLAPIFAVVWSALSAFFRYGIETGAVAALVVVAGVCTAAWILHAAGKRIEVMMTELDRLEDVHADHIQTQEVPQDQEILAYSA